MNTCLRLLKETKWILRLLKFIEYFPDNLSALSRTLLRFFWTTFVETAVYELIIAVMYETTTLRKKKPEKIQA